MNWSHLQKESQYYVLGMGNQAGKERLTKADVEFLKANTRYDEDTIQQWYKGFMKDCPEGKLSPPMFIQIYSKCFPCGNAEEFCAHVFRTFDSDKNGTIDFKEFLLAIDVTSSGSPEEKLNWAFRYGTKIYLLSNPILDNMWKIATIKIKISAKMESWYESRKISLCMKRFKCNTLF